MDDTQRIVKCGNLLLHSPGAFFKKRWHQKYLVLYDGSKSGIKRLELFDSEIKFKKQIPVKIIALVDCVRVVTCQRHKSTYTFEVRTNDQCYLLAVQSFQDMNDWVNCLRLVAFGTQQPASGGVTCPAQRQTNRQAPAAANSSGNSNIRRTNAAVDLLLERRNAQALVGVSSSPSGATAGSSPAQVTTANPNTASSGPKSNQSAGQKPITTASQAVAAAQSALAKSRQRQPSLLGSCKPQPPTDSPFIKTLVVPPSTDNNNQPTTETSQSSSSSPSTSLSAVLSAIGELDHVIDSQQQQFSAGKLDAQRSSQLGGQAKSPTATAATPASAKNRALDEEEENMLYCSIEDNPAEHNYRVKVIETELAVRCQLKCYQLTEPDTINEQYEELSQYNNNNNNGSKRQICNSDRFLSVTFYQLIIGPQELTLLNDYAGTASFAMHKQQQQGLWSWPYQCIRRYGFDKDNCFMFEAGRKCTSGPGQFIVQTPKAHMIYQDVVKFVNELRSLTNDTNGCGLSKASNVILQQNHFSDTNIKNQSVTQIPVAWAGQVSVSSSGSGEVTDRAEPRRAAGSGDKQAGSNNNNRQQFFDTLHQRLDSAQQQQQTVLAVTKESSASNNNNNNNSAIKGNNNCAQDNCQTATITNDSNNADRVNQSNKNHHLMAALVSSKTSASSASQQPASVSSSSSASPASTSGSPAWHGSNSSTLSSVISHDINTAAASAAGHQSSARHHQSTTPVAPQQQQQQPHQQSTIGQQQSKEFMNDNRIKRQQQPQQSATARLVTDQSASLTKEQLGEDEMKTTTRNQSVKAAATAPVDRQQSCKQQPILMGMKQPKQAKLIDTNAAAVHPDELTDESGYEHGDESVDGSAKSITTTTAPAKAAQVNSVGSCGGARTKRSSNGDSASLSPTTSSSSSSFTDSPGQSVSRRHNRISRDLIDQSKGLDNDKNHQSKQQQLLKLHSLLAENSLGTAEEQTDFESNLIRDVYSEITKLHAEFAVTSAGSSNGEGDSMSSKSSCGGGADNDTGLMNQESNPRHSMREPIYGNLRPPGRQLSERSRSHKDLSNDRLDMSRLMSRRVACDHDDDEDDDSGDVNDGFDFGFESGNGFNEGQYRYRSRSMPKFDYDDHTGNDNSFANIPRSRCAKPAPNGHLSEPSPQPHVLARWNHNIANNNNNNNLSSNVNHNHRSDYQRDQAPIPARYPTILNPIPECGEPTVLQNGGQNHQRSGRTVLNQVTNNRIDINRSMNKQTNGNIFNNNNNPNHISDKTKFYQRQANGVAKPTKHYVINDVQYAKISRSLRSRYDSCQQ